MLPLELPWYRRLLGVAILLGLSGGVLSLVYLAGTGAGIDLVFGGAGTGLWTGEWWWVPLTAFGGVVVTALRRRWDVAEHVPGGVEIIEAGGIDHKSAPKWIVLAVISAITGASLGPSFALVVMGGAVGAWIAERRWAEGRADQAYTLTGIAGGLGAAFTSPILGAFMVSELAPTTRRRYVAAIIPELIAASIGFVLYFSVLGRTFLGIYELPPYEFEIADMGTAVGLGALAAVVMAALVAVVLVVRRVAEAVGNAYVFAVVGGAAVGVISLALPLTLGAGQSQLETVIKEVSTLSAGLLILVLVAKMVAVALSLSVGFLGGNVFPMIFIGGTAGVIVHLLVPGIPFALAVSCMLAAVPGSYLRSPISMTFIAVVAVALDARTAAPVAVAVLTSYLLVGTVRYLLAIRRADTPEAEPAPT